jgi:hypothetical protein
MLRRIARTAAALLVAPLAHLDFEEQRLLRRRPQWATFTSVLCSGMVLLSTSTGYANLTPTTPIYTLAVHLETDDGILSGTDSSVYLDLGPVAFQLNDCRIFAVRCAFESGTAYDIDLPVSYALAGEPRFLTPWVRPRRDDLPTLVVADLIELRLEKKGLGGFTNAPDGVIDAAWMANGLSLSPEHQLESARAKLRQLRYALDQAQAALDIAEQSSNVATISMTATEIAFHAQENVVRNAAKIVERLAHDYNVIVDKINALYDTVYRRIDHLCNTPLVVFDPVSCVSVKVLRVVPNPARAPLITELNLLLPKLNAASASVDDAMQKFQQLGQQYVERFKDAEKLSPKYLLAKQTRDLAAKAFGEADTGLAKLATLAAHLPSPEDQLPVPGQWKPKSISLYINGELLTQRSLDDVVLRRGQPEWTSYLSDIPDEEKFVRGLRVAPNGESSTATEEVSRFTALAKLGNISGWRDTNPLSDVDHLEGVLVHRPSAGADRYVSFDLRVTEVVAKGRTFILDGEHEILHNRFIRIEYAREDDTRYTSWKVGDTLAVSGRIRWDTDKYGFYEIHPAGQGQISKIKIVASVARRSALSP